METRGRGECRALETAAAKRVQGMFSPDTGQEESGLSTSSLIFLSTRT